MISIPIKSRLIFSFVANLLRAAAGFFTTLLLARSLGPENFGNMMFLIASFFAVYQLINLGTLNAFFTFLSEYQRDLRFVVWFVVWLFFQLLLLLLAILIVFPVEWISLIWKQDNRLLVCLALAATFWQSVVWNTVTKMCEASRLTKLAQGASVIASVTNLTLLFFCNFLDVLNIEVAFSLIVLVWGLASLTVFSSLRFPNASSKSQSFSSTIELYASYCIPLIPLTFVGFVYSFGDRWLLQNFGGSVEQAYYAIALQFGSVIALITASTLNIFWKEVAEAQHHGDTQVVTSLLQKFYRVLFFLACVGTGYLVPWSEELLLLLVGSSYSAGALTLMVMFLFPVHQSMGQIYGAFAYATSRTRTYASVSVFFMLVSLGISYLLLADTSAPISGFGLGSFGLAVKMVVFQAVQANVLAFLLTRESWSIQDLLFQVMVLAICLTVGWSSYFVASSFSLFVGFDFLLMGLGGILYLGFLVVLALLFPKITGLDEFEFRRLIGARNVMKSK